MISRSNQMQWFASPDSTELSNTNACDSTIYLSSSPPNLLNMNPSEGPVAILWDIENCPVPSDIRPEDVAINIRMALRVHPIIRGAVTLFSAYGDFNAFPRRVREGCQRTGVKLVDVPNGRKDAADKAILVDMFLFALDNRPPCTIMLISGDVDFSPALHILGQRGYTIILVIPSGVGVSSALCNAGRFVWDWQSVARGEGFVPPTRPVMAPPRMGQNENSGYLMGCQFNENQDGFDEEAIVYRGVSQSYYNSKDFSYASQSRSEYTSGASLALPCFSSAGYRAHSLSPGLNEAAPGPSADPNDARSWWVQPGDINGLKGQLLKLLEQSGGCMPLIRIPPEYQKLFGRPLYISEYGACKLVNLLKKFSDVISVEGRGHKRFVVIKNSRAGTSGATLLPPSSLSKDKKGKGFQNGNEDANAAVSGSSDELSDDDRAVLEGNNRSTSSETVQNVGNPAIETRDPELQMFKWELEEILVSYSGKIFLGGFEAIYQQRYKRPLDYGRLGVTDMEELIEKLQDVAVLREEPGGKKKFVAAVGC